MLQTEISTLAELIRQSPALEELFQDDTTEYQTTGKGGIEFDGHTYTDIPKMRSYVRIGELLNKLLPDLEEGSKRLWRANRPGEEKQATTTSFSNSLPGIALPYLSFYEGKLSFVDLPIEVAEASLQDGGTAKGSEFNIPGEWATQANTIDEMRVGVTSAALSLCIEYAKSNDTFDREKFEEWIGTK